MDIKGIVRVVENDWNKSAGRHIDSFNVLIKNFLPEHKNSGVGMGGSQGKFRDKLVF